MIRQSPFLYCVRGVILLSAMLLSSNSIKELPLALTTTMALLLPIFVIIFARMFLQEKISSYCLISMLVGFIGSTTISVHEFYHQELYIIDSYYARSLFWLVFSIILFALSDVINKKYSPVETPVYTMFCIVLYVTLFSAPFAYYTWTDPRPTDLLIAGLLGFGSNASFFCILRAISISKISNLGPLRYIELIFSSLFGFVIFSEIPTQNFYFGCALIIVGNWIVTKSYKN